MFYRHWKKIALALTTLFWVSCSYEDEAQPLYGVAPSQESSSDAATISSSSEASGSNGTTESSSSGNVAESSSSTVAEQSSSSLADNQYRLASDPSVICTAAPIGYTCLDFEDKRDWTEARKKMLEENQTRTLAELDSLEDDLYVGFDYGAPEYGVQDNCTHYAAVDIAYICSNKESPSMNLILSEEDHTLYTQEEYKAKYPEKFQSSSSAEPESSSSVTPPSPLCQKTDFATTGELEELFEKDLAAILDSVKAEKGETLSQQDSNCLAHKQELGGEIILRKNNDPYSVDVLAKKQICDGDTTVNPHYQKQIDKIEDYLKREIDDCLTPPDPAP
ncbi:MAG: hypothetical protein J6W54_14230 [Fibrobacter sp.]|uniref:hypothetical protein n=1 Tax=Fibrobacter sp. TaxID=35828 RepID=UPI001B25D10A|nr:hypothetical protein [Fibrobacter sp.]MBO7062228.1 hypothetical protein [Fibrobacter sp.]